MELFDTYFVWFGQVLAVSGKKMLVISHRSVQVVKSQPYKGSFQNMHLLQDENKHQIMNVQAKWNCFLPILSGLVKYYLFQGRKR